MNVSVIIVNYNTCKETAKCIASLYKHISSTTFEVIVVDNNSTTIEIECLENETSQYHGLTLIKNDENVGFGSAMNLGMSKAIGDYFLLLNSDAHIKDDSIIKSFEFMKKNDLYKILTCKILYDNGTQQKSVRFKPEQSVYDFFSKNIILNKILPSIKLKSGLISNSCPVPCILGAAIFLSKDIYTLTKGFDTDFFMYSEEVEWIYRRVSKYTQPYYFNDSTIYHSLGQSSSNNWREGQMSLSKHLFYYKKSYTLFWLHVIIVGLLNPLTVLLGIRFINNDYRYKAKTLSKIKISAALTAIRQIPRYPKKLNSRRSPLKWKL